METGFGIVVYQKKFQRNDIVRYSKCSLANDKSYCHATLAQKCNISDGFLEIRKFQKHGWAESDG